MQSEYNKNLYLNKESIMNNDFSSERSLYSKNENDEKDTLIFNSKRVNKHASLYASEDTLDIFSDNLQKNKKKKSNAPPFDVLKAFNSETEIRNKPKKSKNKEHITQTANEPTVTQPKKISSYDMAQILMENGDYTVSDGQLYYYCPALGYWKLIRGNEANRDLRKLIPSGYESHINKSYLSEVYEWLLTNAKVINSFETEENKYYINFKDCAVNWKTGEIVTERKKLYFRYTINFNYHYLPAKTGAYENFLNDIFDGNKKLLREFRKFIGLCISDIRTQKYSFFLYGPSNSGKSVMLNVLKGIIGNEWCSSLSFSQMGSEFAITELLGKRLNISGEVSGASNKRLDIFKSLTGNDKVTACYKGKDHFQFENKSLLVFACNVFPNINSPLDMESFISRIIIFPFSKVKPRSEWIDNLEELLLNDIGEIIKDAIQGLKEFEDDNFQFIETKAMKRCKMEFQGMFDSFTLFADEYILQEADSIATSQQIGGAYRKYCTEQGYIAFPDNIWGPLLMQKHMCKKTTVSISDSTGTKRVRGYKGIKLTYYDESDLE